VGERAGASGGGLANPRGEAEGADEGDSCGGVVDDEQPATAARRIRIRRKNLVGILSA